MPFIFFHFYEKLDVNKIDRNRFESCSPLFPYEYPFFGFGEEYKDISFIFSNTIKNRLLSLYLKKRIYSVKDLRKSFNDVIEKINQLKSKPISIYP